MHMLYTAYYYTLLILYMHIIIITQMIELKINLSAINYNK